MTSSAVLLSMLLLQLAETATAPRPAPVTAPAAAEPESDEESEMAALMAIIDEETEIATKTRMNSDYVPGVVTVLQGNELKLLGVHTVWEAMALVPGVQAVIDKQARPSLAVRGTDFPFNAGNVKILIDGVPLNRDMSGVTSFILWFPVENVERIEVIRGPGSVIHGDFAFMGLINIITRKDTTGVYARGHSNGLGGGGAMANWRRDDLHLYTNLGASRGVDHPLLDARAGDLHRASGVVGLQAKGFTLSAHIIDHAVNETTAATGRPGTSNAEERDWSVEAGYELELTPTLRGAVRAGYLNNDLANTAAAFRGDMLRLGSDLTYSGWERQSWFLAVEYIRSDIDFASQMMAPAAPVPGQPPAPPAASRSLIVKGQGREVASLTIQNQLDVSEQWSFIPGVRFDSYSDVANRFTPRFALVWRASESHIIKGQYAEGFRAPTFFELYQGGVRDSGLTFEVNKTSELHYTFRQPETVFRATAFYSQIEDMFLNGASGIDNLSHASVYGTELELTQQIASWAKFVVNGTWYQAEDNRNTLLETRPNPSAPAWMSDAAIFLSPFENTVIGPHWNHIASPHVAGVGANDLVDVTLTQSDLVLTGLEARAGVKNLLDDQAVYVTRDPLGVSSIFSGFGRSYWLGLGWEL